MVSLVLVCACLLSPAAAAEGNPPLKKATFMPIWFPQAQFAGYYVALEEGFYEKRGIDLTILPGGAASSPTEILATGEVDFALLWLSDAIQKRDDGIELVNIAQMSQRSAIMFVAKKESGIRSPEDMDGKKVGLWRGDFQLQPLAFFRKYGLEVEIVPQSFSPDYINLFLLDAVDVTTAMWYNEYHKILNSGINPEELVTFFFNDYGLNFPEEGVYVLGETLERDPGLCDAFVEASLEGWAFAFDNPERALDIVLAAMEAEHVPASRVHQRWMLKRMRDLMVSDDSYPMGFLRKDDYEREARLLLESGLIEEIPPYESMYRDRFNPAGWGQP
jgi:NitT/TauT family transport system substrate-binding protein